MDSAQTPPAAGEESPAEPDAPAPPSEPVAAEDSTVGTGSIFGIGCTVLALLFVCVGVAIFMWRQVN
jgi:hypothetical protein